VLDRFRFFNTHGNMISKVFSVLSLQLSTGYVVQTERERERLCIGVEYVERSTLGRLTNQRSNKGRESKQCGPKAHLNTWSTLSEPAEAPACSWRELVCTTSTTRRQ
jgi:hypothetical protein